LWLTVDARNWGGVVFAGFGALMITTLISYVSHSQVVLRLVWLFAVMS
jgi:hypothetical protein